MKVGALLFKIMNNVKILKYEANLQQLHMSNICLFVC